MIRGTLSEGMSFYESIRGVTKQRERKQSELKTYRKTLSF